VFVRRVSVCLWLCLIQRDRVPSTVIIVIIVVVSFALNGTSQLQTSIPQTSVMSIVGLSLSIQPKEMVYDQLSLLITTRAAQHSQDGIVFTGVDLRT